MLSQHNSKQRLSFSRCLILILELPWNKELQKTLKQMKMSQSYAYTKEKSSQWPHFIKAWKPHILLWCLPVPEEEQVCNTAKRLGTCLPTTLLEESWEITLPSVFQVHFSNMHMAVKVRNVLSFYYKGQIRMNFWKTLMNLFPKISCPNHLVKQLD